MKKMKIRKNVLYIAIPACLVVLICMILIPKLLYYPISGAELYPSSQFVEDKNVSDTYELTFDGVTYLGEYKGSYDHRYSGEAVDRYNFEGGYFEIFKESGIFYKICFDREIREVPMYPFGGSEGLVGRKEEFMTKYKESAEAVLSAYVDLKEYAFHSDEFWDQQYRIDGPVRYFQFMYCKTLGGYYTNDTVCVRYTLDGEVLAVWVEDLFTDNELSLKINKSRLDRTVLRELQKDDENRENLKGADGFAYDEAFIYKLNDGSIVFKSESLMYTDAGGRGASITTDFAVTLKKGR